MNIDYQSIGKRIKTARSKVDITQESLAKKTKLSITHISNIEHGNTKLSLSTLTKIAAALNTSVDVLLSESLENNRKGFENELKSLLSDCTNSEIQFLLSLLYTNKKIIRQYIDFADN